MDDLKRFNRIHFLPPCKHGENRASGRGVSIGYISYLPVNVLGWKRRWRKSFNRIHFLPPCKLSSLAICELQDSFNRIHFLPPCKQREARRKEAREVSIGYISYLPVNAVRRVLVSIMVSIGYISYLPVNLARYAKGFGGKGFNRIHFLPPCKHLCAFMGQCSVRLSRKPHIQAGCPSPELHDLQLVFRTVRTTFIVHGSR